MNKIEFYRKQANLTQEGLAKKSCVSREHLSNIENGKFEPNLKTLKKIAKALSIEVKDLV